MDTDQRKAFLTSLFDHVETAAVSELQAAGRHDVSDLVQHQILWMEGERKAARARHWIDRRILGLVLENDSRAVLDAGCGFGATLQYLNDSLTEPVNLAGITLGRTEFQAANEVIQRRNLQSRMRLFCADYHDALSWRPFPSRDFVYSIETLHQSPDPGAFLGGAARVLASGGILAVAGFFAGSGKAGEDPALMKSLETFRAGCHGADLVSAVQLAGMAAGRDLEAVSDEDLSAGIREDLLGRFGLVAGTPFAQGAGLRAFRAAAQASRVQVPGLVRHGLLEYRLMVFRKA